MPGMGVEAGELCRWSHLLLPRGWEGVRTQCLLWATWRLSSGTEWTGGSGEGRLCSIVGEATLDSRACHKAIRAFPVSADVKAAHNGSPAFQTFHVVFYLWGINIISGSFKSMFNYEGKTRLLWRSQPRIRRRHREPNLCLSVEGWSLFPPFLDDPVNYAFLVLVLCVDSSATNYLGCFSQDSLSLALVVLDFLALILADNWQLLLMLMVQIPKRKYDYLRLLHCHKGINPGQIMCLWQSYE